MSMLPGASKGSVPPTGLSPAVVGAAGATPPAGERERNRNGYLWHFLAWSFLVGEGLGLDGFFASRAKAANADQDGDGKASAYAAQANQYGAPDGGGETLAADDGDGEDVGGNEAPQGRMNAAVEPQADGGGEGYLAKVHGSGTVYNSSAPHSIDPAGIGGVGGSGGFAGFGVSMVVPIEPTQIVLPLYASEVTFFEGLGTFSEALGFSSDPFSIAAEIGGGANASVLGALSFAEHPMTAVPVWQSLGGLDGDLVLASNDGFNVDWVVQASGITKNGQSQFTASHGIEGGIYANSAHDSEAGLGNRAIIEDGQDWDGALWVTGNYYEFNTIIQINVLWDKDTVTVERVGSGSEIPAMGPIDSGNNVQSNAAQIIDIEDHDSHSQLIVGGKEEHFAAVQLNSIVDIDTIEFHLDDILHGVNAPGLLNGFGDVYAGGHDQSNTSLMMSGGDYEVHAITPERFLARHQDQIKLVNGHFYEFNTIVQINVVNDADDIRSMIDGYRNTANDVIASGGNIQFNEATIRLNDNHDALFVGGRYTQYNLALQINSIDDSDVITQKSHRELGPVGGDDHGYGHSDGVNGDHGDDGSSMPAVNIAAPSVIEDMLVRGNDALT